MTCIKGSRLLDYWQSSSIGPGEANGTGSWNYQHTLHYYGSICSEPRWEEVKNLCPKCGVLSLPNSWARLLLPSAWSEVDHIWLYELFPNSHHFRPESPPVGPHGPPYHCGRTRHHIPNSVTEWKPPKTSKNSWFLKTIWFDGFWTFSWNWTQ